MLKTFSLRLVPLVVTFVLCCCGHNDSPATPSMPKSERYRGVSGACSVVNSGTSLCIETSYAALAKYDSKTNKDEPHSDPSSVFISEAMNTCQNLNNSTAGTNSAAGTTTTFVQGQPCSRTSVVGFCTWPNASDSNIDTSVPNVDTMFYKNVHIYGTGYTVATAKANCSIANGNFSVTEKIK